jgi:hypothetical protein
VRGPVNWRPYLADGLDWLIVGGESGEDFRPMECPSSSSKTRGGTLAYGAASPMRSGFANTLERVTE